MLNKSTIFPPFAALVLAAALLGGVAACDIGRSVLEQAERRGELRVATVNGPTTYFLGREGPAGFEYDLAAAYAAHKGLGFRVSVHESADAALQAVDSGEADIAAAALIPTPERLRERRFSAPYMSVAELIVCRRGGEVGEDRQGRMVLDVVAPASVAPAGRLAALNTPDLAISLDVDSALTRADALASVSSGLIPCTVASARQYALEQRYMPHLEVMRRSGDEVELSWAIAGRHKGAGLALKADIDAWIALPDTTRMIATLEERYFGFRPEEVGAAHASRFRVEIERTLPKYEALFRKEAARQGVPWTLLAAVAYQESHWDPRAKSPTGVRGMMMLTLPTARQYGVKSRLDENQSVKAGARHLKRLYNRLSPQVAKEERWWFAAAAYNIGYGHLSDARELVARRGGNPDQWADVRQILPLLEDPAEYGELTYGYARGREAQTYVRRVRDFADVLEKRFDSQTKAGKRAR